MRFEGVDDRNGGRGAAGRDRSTAEPLADAPPGELWVHELIGAEVRDRGGRAIGRVVVGRGEPRARPARARRRRARSRWCSSSSTTPGVVVVDLPEGLLRPLTDAVRIDVFTIFPEYLDAPLAGVAASAARASAGCSTCACTIRARSTTDRHRSVDDAPFGGGAGMVMMPEPLFAAVEAVAAAAAAVAAVGERPALRPGASPRELAAGDRVLAALRPLRRRRPAGRRSPAATASCRSATTCSPAARRPRSS